MAAFINSLQAEWIKRRRSLASLLVISGAFFIPMVIIVVRIFHAEKLPELYNSPNFWEKLWQNSWESMALFLVPLGIIMATSLVAQLEFKNNAWKQLHTTPLGLTTVFFSKYTIVIFMVLEFFVLFNIGIYLSAVIPFALTNGTPYPVAPIPFAFFLSENALFFIDCLPIIALQYLLSLQFKNFLIPFGTGFMLWILSIGCLAWKYNYTIPYTHGMLNYLKDQTRGRAVIPDANIHWFAIGYFTVFTIAGYVLYVTKKEKG
jgi:hypothetical protein